MFSIKSSSLQKKLGISGLTRRLVLFIILLAGLPFVVYAALNLHAEDESLRLAKSFSTVISTVRSYYATNVAKRLLESHGNAVLSENYQKINGGIPIPATLSIELGEILREKSSEDGFLFSFVSDMPFLNRDRRPLEEFQEIALKKFRTQAGVEEYWAVEKVDAISSVMRYAVPVRMEPTCVTCHNSHPDSPMKAWKAGDVRGIQDVQVNLSIGGQAESSLFLGVYLLIFIISAGLALREALANNNELKKLNHEKNISESELRLKRDQLEKNIAELSTKTAVIEKAPFGIAIAHTKGNELLIDYANENFLDTTGFSQEQIKGKTYRLLLGGETNPEAIKKLTDAVISRENIELELILYRVDGSKYWARCLFFPTYDVSNVFQNFIICQSDITELKNSEMERNNLAGELQESLKLESLGLTIAGIAHDLNTPIGVSTTAITFLEDRVRQLIESELKDGKNQNNDILSQINEAANLVKSNLSKAATLVRSFKQTSLDATRYEWQEVNLSIFLNTLVTALSPVTRRSNAKVTISCPEYLNLYTEPGSLSQVITNLVVNATTHAFDKEQEERKISIDVEKQDEIIHIFVSDNGGGIPGEVLSKLFTPFYTTKRSSGGTGLGLFTAKRIVEEMLGGNLIFKSQAGQGAIFEIIVPIKGGNHVS